MEKDSSIKVYLFRYEDIRKLFEVDIGMTPEEVFLEFDKVKVYLSKRHLLHQLAWLKCTMR